MWIIYFWSHNSGRWAWQITAYFINEKKTAQRLSDILGLHSQSTALDESLHPQVSQARVTANKDNAMLTQVDGIWHLTKKKKKTTSGDPKNTVEGFLGYN